MSEIEVSSSKKNKKNIGSLIPKTPEKKVKGSNQINILDHPTLTNSYSRDTTYNNERRIPWNKVANPMNQAGSQLKDT